MHWGVIAYIINSRMSAQTESQVDIFSKILIPVSAISQTHPALSRIHFQYHFRVVFDSNKFFNQEKLFINGCKVILDYWPDNKLTRVFLNPKNCVFWLPITHFDLKNVKIILQGASTPWRNANGKKGCFTEYLFLLPLL